MKPKLLVLTPRFPYPPIGGDRLRIYRLCKHLASDFDLSLLSICCTPEEMQYAVPQDGVFQRIERVFHSRTKRLFGFLKVLPSRTPLQVGYYRSAQFMRRLDELAPAHDGVLAHLIRTGDYLVTCTGPRFLEMTDAISLSYSRTYNHRISNILWAAVYRHDAQRLRDYERRLIGGLDLVVFTSPVDRDFLFPHSGREKTLICPNGVDAEAFPFQFNHDRTTIVYIGNMTAYHNIDAVLYFIERILPAIRHRHPQARLKVVGKIKSKMQRRLQRFPGVDVTGPVDRVPDAVRGCGVGVCPVRFGAGIQNKLLEYMALGIPAVTSPIGMEGIEATPGINLLLARSPEEWVDHVCRLLEDTELARTLAIAGRDLVERQYSWESRIAPLRAAIAKRLSDYATSRVA